MPKLRAQRRLAAILAADIADYSRMMGADEAGTLNAVRDVWAERFTPTVAEYRGRVVKMMGDGALVEFGSAVDAVECGIAIQGTMAALNDTRLGEELIEMRIGINLGDIVIEGDDIFGDGVNIAARLESRAPRNGILMSDAVHSQVQGKVAEAFADAGELELKNITAPVRAWRWGGAAWQLPETVVEVANDGPSIAVLPFANMSGDPEQDYFSDGITDDIITDLSKIPGLLVVARNSSFAYKGKSPDIRVVGRDLGVGAVLEGSIRRSGNRVRITAQLIDTKTGGHLWAERYDRDLTDIFAVQDEVTLQIVGALRITLDPVYTNQFHMRRTSNVAAHDILLRSRDMAMRMLKNEVTGRDAIEKLIETQKRAIELDPEFGGAYAGLAFSYLTEYQNKWAGIPDPLALAATNADCAIEKDPTSAFGWVACAVVKINQRDLAGAKGCAEMSLRHAPNYGTAYGCLGQIEIFLGNPQAAMPYLDRAIRLDPAFSHQFIHFRGLAYLVLGDYAKAASAFRDRIRLSPKTDLSRSLLASALGHMGDTATAKKVWSELMAINPKYSLVEHLARMPFQNPDDRESIAKGLAIAGLPE